MLSGSHTIDFGHWVTEYLPKVAIATLAGLPNMSVLIDEKIPQRLVESLELFLPNRTGTINVPHLSPVRVKRLWVASNPMYMGFYPTVWGPDTWTAMATHPSSFAALLDELKRLSNCEVSRSGGFERVFLARKPSRVKKRMVNHVEIEALARERGFQVIYPEDLPFGEQIRVAHQAKYLMGPEGSNMLLPIFGSTGAKVCVLTSPNTFPLADINGIVTQRGIDYTLFTGPFVTMDEDWLFWNDYRIDTTSLAEFLDEWLKAGRSPGRYA
jgi:capsular polysaccharide biosynthesis protein